MLPRGCCVQVIHFDIKSANILLTSNLDDMVRLHSFTYLRSLALLVDTQSSGGCEACDGFAAKVLLLVDSARHNQELDVQRCAGPSLTCS